MSGLEWAVIVGGVASIAFLLWFFFGAKKGKAAVFRARVQEATIRVEGAYGRPQCPPAQDVPDAREPSGRGACNDKAPDQSGGHFSYASARQGGRGGTDEGRHGYGH